MTYDQGHRTVELICRCKKKLFTFTAWKQHLQAKHPKFYKELRDNGSLEQDRLDFRRQV